MSGKYFQIGDLIINNHSKYTQAMWNPRKDILFELKENQRESFKMKY